MHTNKLKFEGNVYFVHYRKLAGITRNSLISWSLT